jgi:hypothetical protein
MSSKDLAGFQLDLRNFATKIPSEEINKLARAIAMDALKGVVLKTPVDTGRARGNWEVTTGKPSVNVDIASYEGKHIPEKLAETVVASRAIENGAGVIATAEPEKQVIWVSNNVPYIEELENGSSKQARNPDGMVMRTLLEIKEKYK